MAFIIPWRQHFLTANLLFYKQISMAISKRPAGAAEGGSVTQGTTPWVDNITPWGSAALGAPSTYGTSPGAVTVPGVNAFVTNALSLAIAPLTSTNLSGSITTTNTFLSIQVSTSGRKGCAIQNNGTHLMYVYFGAIGSATEAT